MTLHHGYIATKSRNIILIRDSLGSTSVYGAAHCIKLLGGRVEACHDYTIPGTDVTHRLVVIRKVAPTLKGYPRKWAKIQKDPL